uniref:Zgc:123244 n=1 Tax=Neogobius melanostomus TaxID=47308 RepID=A0A8C6WLM0_9GOBI
MWLWALLPLSLAVFGSAGIWIVYAMSVSNGTVNITERFPYISECGSYTPQSTIFSQYCNICALLGLWIIVIRFQQVRDYGDHGKANILSLVLGFVSCLGVSILGNFQQSVQLVVHLVGAFTAFFLGVGYFWVQLFLTYRAQPSHDRHWVGPSRALGCCLCTVLVIAMVALANTGHGSAAAMCEWAWSWRSSASSDCSRLSSDTSTVTTSQCRNTQSSSTQTPHLWSPTATCL